MYGIDASAERRPDVTAVIPTKNAATTIARCVRSTVAQCGVSVEIVVVDNASSDGTAAIAKKLGCTVLEGGPERSAQRNAGARAGSGRWLLLLDADMDVQPGAVASAIDAAERAGAVACVIPERATGEGYWAACRALEKEIYLGDKDVEAARLFRRDIYF